MDLGTFSEVRFSALPSNIDLTSPIKSMDEWNRACNVHNALQAKLSVVQRYESYLTHQIADLQTRNMCLIQFKPRGTNHSTLYQLRMVVLHTSLHAVRRYKFVVQGDILNLHQYLDYDIASQSLTWARQMYPLWQELRPNVHDLLLHQLEQQRYYLLLWNDDVQEEHGSNNEQVHVLELNSNNGDQVRHPTPIPWRPSQ